MLCSHVHDKHVGLRKLTSICLCTCVLYVHAHAHVWAGMHVGIDTLILRLRSTDKAECLRSCVEWAFATVVCQAQ